jgi:type IV pilus assembly protein PilM
MAANGAVWGIDIGSCALKAIRCRKGDSAGQIVAEGFDYVEYPTILGQPDADDATLIRDALKTFLSRNTLRGDQVAISVSGQNGLARFIKLPPVEAKKIPEIVRYEARQQIPFKLEEVIWDYQQLPGGGETEGFALEAEVGLFAMKRDQVFRALQPLEQVGIEVNYIQLAPLAIFNFAAFDQLKPITAEGFDPENPPESTVLLSIGTETTDLVITNGLRVWQRSIPLGGNHYTRALTKQLKLTFGKAEHLKRNAGAASTEDAKAVVKAMRPVFDDMVTEVQTSLRYFKMNVDKNANLGRIIGLGNAMKLLGLRAYLAQKLEMEVVRPEAFAKLVGPSVVAAPVFKDNILAFATSYGLALQGLGESVLRTNLLPQELNMQRIIRDKKPWALAAAAGLMFGMTVNYMGHWYAWRPTVYGKEYEDAASFVSTVEKEGQEAKSAYDAEAAKHKEIAEIGTRLAKLSDRPRLVPELAAAIVASLPRNPARAEDAPPLPIADRLDLQIEQVNLERLPNFNLWFTKDVQDRYYKQYPNEKPAGEGETPTDSAPPADGGADAGAANDSGGENAESAVPPGKPGCIVTIVGKHFHNKPGGAVGLDYVKQTLMEKLKNGSVMLPGSDGQPKEVKMSALGIQKPVLIKTSPIEPQPNPVFGVLDDPKNPQPREIPTFNFTLQFWWEETPLSVREAPPKPTTESPDTSAQAAN